eukprot:gene7779-biopygen19588
MQLFALKTPKNQGPPREEQRTRPGTRPFLPQNSIARTRPGRVRGQFSQGHEHFENTSGGGHPRNGGFLSYYYRNEPSWRP